MTTKKMIIVISSFIGLVMIFGFSKDKNKDNGFVSIPMGCTTINGKAVSLESYWISNHEITNKEYNDFLADLKKLGKEKEYEVCKVHNDKWITSTNNYYAPFAEYYSSHEAYASYPVLNISYEAASLYCDWLTEKNEDKSQMYRLPTKDEWIYAAKGGFDNNNYSWGGNYLRNKKGQFLCNFKNIGNESIHIDNDSLIVLKDVQNISLEATITSPVYSYWANQYGLFNTCGNVAEMVFDKGLAMGGSWKNSGYDVRITSEILFSEPNPCVGFRPVRVRKE